MENRRLDVFYLDVNGIPQERVPVKNTIDDVNRLKEGFNNTYELWNHPDHQMYIFRESSMNKNVTTPRP